MYDKDINMSEQNNEMVTEFNIISDERPSYGMVYRLSKTNERIYYLEASAPILSYVYQDMIFDLISKVNGSKDRFVRLCRELVRFVYINPYHMENMMIIPIKKSTKFRVYTRGEWMTLPRKKIEVTIFCFLQKLLSDYHERYPFKHAVSADFVHLANTYLCHFNEEIFRPFIREVMTVFDEPASKEIFEKRRKIDTE